jgi:hypothetical protein
VKFSYFFVIFLFSYLTPLCFTEMSDGPMWRFLKRWCVIKEGDFSPRHMDNSDEVRDEGSQASDKFHCTSATTDKKGPSFQ